MARRKASVQSLAFASTWNVRFGKTGGLMRARIAGITVRHGSSWASSRRGETVMAAAPSREFLMKSRRFIFSVLLVPCRVFLLQQLRGFFDVPGITSASLVLDLGDVVSDHAITTNKDRSISLHFIEARPDWTSFRIFHYHAIDSIWL